MMQESELSRAAGRLRAVEQAFREMEEYASNIPDDPDFSFGVRVEWVWGSSTTGYEVTRHAVRKAVEKNMRQLVIDAVSATKAELLDAQRELKKAV